MGSAAPQRYALRPHGWSLEMPVYEERNILRMGPPQHPGEAEITPAMVQAVRQRIRSAGGSLTIGAVLPFDRVPRGEGDAGRIGRASAREDHCRNLVWRPDSRVDLRPVPHFFPATVLSLNRATNAC